jgi:hypothetical protein
LRGRIPVARQQIGHGRARRGEEILHGRLMVWHGRAGILRPKGVEICGQHRGMAAFLATGRG